MPARSTSVVGRLAVAADGLARRAWFSYLAIALLQLRVIWGFWDSPYLGVGDTSYYFVAAKAFAAGGEIGELEMSPLYQIFYGVLVAVFEDYFVATAVHRVILALAAALLALAAFRQLLPAAIAWALAAWWAVLPSIGATLYEIHLFGVLPVLVACAVAASRPSAAGRGAALGILVAAGFGVRNELLPAALFFALACLVCELRGRDAGAPRGVAPVRAYGWPLLLAALLPLLLHARIPAGYDVAAEMDSRHRVNMAQVFAFGFQQREPAWTASPWSEYHELMTERFGTAEPTLGEMAARNPGELAEHLRWNLGLVPDGLRLLLFGATSGDVTPDYVAVPRRPAFVALCSVVYLAVVAAGLLRMMRRPAQWRRELIGSSGGGWAVLIAVSLVVPAIVLTQRPRPSYLFGFAAFLMAAAGLGVHALTRDASGAVRLLRYWPLAALVLPLAATPYLSRDSSSPEVPYARFATHAARLAPHAAAMAGGSLYTIAFPLEVVNVVCLRSCRLAQPVMRRPAAGVPLDEYLDSIGADLFYLDEILRLHVERGAPASTPQPFLDFTPPGWTAIESVEAANERWGLFERDGGRAMPRGGEGG